MLRSNCRVCGNPMYSQNSFGTELDGSLNPDYCSNCYKAGQFFSRYWDAWTNYSGSAFTTRAGEQGKGI